MKGLAKYMLIATAWLRLVLVGSGILFFLTIGLEPRGKIKIALIQRQVINSENPIIPGSACTRRRRGTARYH
ncbi:hypothetical protein FIM08_00865 [SAR202 cluster bacterium AC-647-N09_OGT_505m]|nr:hypothetical protein [SAR202 cluster bacterium AC-647-N09_OGT_505m]